MNNQQMYRNSKCRSESLNEIFADWLDSGRLTDNLCWSLIQESSTAALIGAASDFSVRQLESVISELQLYYVPLYDIRPNMKMDLNSPAASQQTKAIRGKRFEVLTLRE